MTQSRHRACDDFHRTQGAAPAPGMTRRALLGTGLAVWGASALPASRLFERAAEAAEAAPDAPVLVSVFLPGGVDLLDSIVPLGQYGAYRSARGVLAQPENTPRLGSTGFGVHSALARGDFGGLKGLFESGRIALLPGIDYANPDLSHFRSRAFWESGLVTARSATGWLGRWLDATGGAASQNPFQGLTAGHRLSPLLRSGGAPVASLESARHAELEMAGLAPAGPEFARSMQTWAELGYPRRTDGPALAAVKRAARFSSGVATGLRPLAATAPQPAGRSGGSAPALLPGLESAPATGYPPGSALGDRLASLAFLLAQPLGIRTATVDADNNFDTHHSQAGVLAAGLEECSRALAAFQADLERRGLGDRVLTFVWSEFGRRVRANQSSGTDHGAGGLAWVMGTRARGGILSDYPSLTDLDAQRNLKVTVDFRAVYASLIEQWLGTDAGAVLPESAGFGRVQLVR